MIEDFWLGVLSTSVAALAMALALVSALVVWVAAKLSGYTDYSVTKTKSGKVQVSAEVKL